jgi:hypothetical protein
VIAVGGNDLNRNGAGEWTGTINLSIPNMEHTLEFAVMLNNLWARSKRWPGQIKDISAGNPNATLASMVVVEHWFEELKTRVR